MKKFVCTTLCFLIPFTSIHIFAEENISDHAENTEKLYQEGTGAMDGAYTATSISMIGWGIGLAAGIAILAACLHQSKASSSHSD